MVEQQLVGFIKVQMVLIIMDQVVQAVAAQEIREVVLVHNLHNQEIPELMDTDFQEQQVVITQIIQILLMVQHWLLLIQVAVVEVLVLLEVILV